MRALTVALLGALTVLALAVFGAPAHATPSEQELDKQIETKSRQFDKAVQKYDKIQDNLKAARKRAAALSRKIKPLQNKVNDARNRVGKIAAAAYRGGNVGALNALMSSGSSNSVLDSLATLDQLAHKQKLQIDKLNDDKAALDRQKRKYDSAIDEQSKQAKKLKARKASLDRDVNKLRDMRTAAYGPPANTSTQDYGPPPGLPGSAGKAVDFAWNQLGKPYQYGAAGPDAYDCSGLTMAAWNAAGYSLPHNAAAQHSSTASINRSDLAPGDLVFYNGDNHVGIYIGNGTIIHAPTPGQPVQKAGVDSMPITGYGRVH